MNMYSHGITKADGQAKNIGKVIKLRIQGEGRSQSQEKPKSKMNAMLIKVSLHGRV